MHFQPNLQHPLGFNYSLFLVVVKSAILKRLCNHTALFTSVLDTAIPIVNNASTNLNNKEITYGY